MVQVGKHPLFGRRGRNLTLTVPVTFPEAALGSTVTVPTLDEPGDPARPGRARRSGTDLPGEGPGRARRHGRTRRAGDLLVTVEVTVPKKLTDEQRAAVEALRRGLRRTGRGHRVRRAEPGTTAHRPASAEQPTRGRLQPAPSRPAAGPST